MTATARQHELSLKLYGLFSLCQAAYFWAPLFFLYFSSVVPLRQVFLLEAIYYAAVVITEVPSGYASDRFGRKKTLLASALFLSLAYLLFFTARGFLMLAAAQILLALGFAFASGTDTSLHFALLRAAGKEEEYGERESVLGSRIFIAGALCALTGGLLAWGSEYRSAYLLSFVFAAAALISILFIKEPEEERDPDGASVAGQARLLKATLSHPVLRFLFAFALLSVVLRHIPYEFIQPYIRELSARWGKEELTPLVTGIHTALVMLISSQAVRLAMPLKRRLGSRAALLLTIGAQTALIAVLLAAGSLPALLFLLFRSAPGSFSTPILRSELSPRVSDSQRATLYSLQSLAGRLGFSTLLLAFNRLSAEGTRSSLLLGTLFGLTGLILLLFMGSRIRR